MLAKDRRATIFTSLAILLPLFIGLAKWNEIPNFGAINIDLQLLNFDLSYKFMAVVMAPLTILVLHLLWAIPLSKSPSRKSIGKTYTLSLCMGPFVSMLTLLAIFQYKLGMKIDTVLIMNLFMGIFFVIAGNYYPKIKRTSPVGMNFPWTCANEMNWNKTHRLAGILYMIFGVFVIVISLVSRCNKPSIVSVGMLVIILISAGYSYYLHVKKNL
ncbi:MAG: SdpI family protein [[Eubacterium] sulci]|nr:SdpI family protein [[Eubacterium] sulci]